MQTAGDPIRVLHVDDQPDFAEMTATFLERSDDRFTVETATSADEGLDRLAGDGFDCVVSDYDMPGQDGIEFLEAVRERRPDLPFILYTGKGSEEVASDAISAGATDYLQKGGKAAQYDLLANRIQNAVEQFRDKQRRETLERVRGIVNDVNQALVRADSRGEIERQVCEILSGSEPFRFAVVAGVSCEPKQIEPRTWAGTGEPFLEEFEMTIEEGAPGRHAPGGRAYHGREIAVAQNIQSDPAYEPWRELALEHDFQALAVVPLEYESDLYGLLAIMADRPHAFDETEQEVLAELGDDIAHALHAQEIRGSLRRSQRRFEAVFEDPQMLIGILEPDGTVIDNNRTAMAFVDADPDDVVGEPFWDTPWWPADIREEVRGWIEDAAAGEYVEYEADLTTPDGEPYSVNGTVRPVTDSRGNVVSLVVSARDVTDRRQRERAVEELHNTAQALARAETDDEVADIVVGSMSDILDMPLTTVWFLDEDESALYPVAWTGWVEEVIGEVPRFRPDDSLAWEAFEAGEPHQYDDVSTAPGAYNPDTPVRSEVILPLCDHGVMVVGSTEAGEFDEIDVSLAETVATHAETALDRIEREASLRAERGTIEQLFETSPVGITIVAPDGTIRRANEHAEEVLGLTRSEITGRTYDDPEWGIIDEDGDPVPGDDLPFRRVLETGEPVFDYEHGIEWPDGTRRWLSINAAPLTAEGGEIDAVITVIKDVTARREREREIERQNERLERFASIVSHDLRNPLTVADGHLELAREECESAHLDAIGDALDRSQTLLDDILTLAREGKQVNGAEAVDLADVAESCWAHVETADATLVTEADKSIRAEPGRLKQLLENLIRNAVEHGGDEVTITVGDFDGGFYVADDGPGIPDDEREQVFESGYSTSEEGTGFGLSIVAETASAQGWDVAVTDSDAGGARFEVSGVESA